MRAQTLPVNLTSRNNYLAWLAYGTSLSRILNQPAREFRASPNYMSRNPTSEWSGRKVEMIFVGGSTFTYVSDDCAKGIMERDDDDGSAFHQPYAVSNN